MQVKIVSPPQYGFTLKSRRATGFLTKKKNPIKSIKKMMNIYHGCYNFTGFV